MKRDKKHKQLYTCMRVHTDERAGEERIGEHSFIRPREAGSGNIPRSLLI